MGLEPKARCSICGKDIPLVESCYRVGIPSLCLKCKGVEDNSVSLEVNEEIKRYEGYADDPR